MFRRSKSDSDLETAPAPATAVELGKNPGKGRPTPSRREAEAAARARNKPARTRKEQIARQRAVRSESSSRIREAMKTGDERYLLPRDKGPVRRFTRDFVDSRFSVAEVAIPVMLVALFVPALTLPLFLVLTIDLVLLRFRLRKQIAQRMPEEPLKGVTFYALTRAMQMRFMRLPKPQVRIGQTLDGRYR